MKCEISMCVQHLQVHLTTPVLLQTHPLTEPMALCGTTKCPQHGKLLEYYCLDDMTCVCVSCAIEDQHRLHNMKTFSTAHRDLMEKLKDEQKALLVKTDDKNVSLEKWEATEREKLSQSGVRLIEAVSGLRDISLASIQSSVSARMVSIKTSKSSMQAAQNEKDTFRFLQMYSQVHQDMEKAKAVDLRKGLEPGHDRDKLVQELRQSGENMVSQAEQFRGDLLMLVDPENHQELFSTGDDLIFEPQRCNPTMSLSNNNRAIFYNSWSGQCAATLLIRGTKSVTNFQRWLVSLPKELDWTIGLCDKNSINLKKGPVYGLRYSDNQLSSLTTECSDNGDTSGSSKGMQTSNRTQTGKQYKVSTALITQPMEETEEEDEPTEEEDKPRAEIVEVFWNFVASSLSFFRRTGQYQREEILTIAMSLNNWDLVPFVQLGAESAQSSDNWSQQQWRCSCGQIHYFDYSSYCNGYSQQSQRPKCSCGKIIGSEFITELVCELL